MRILLTAGPTREPIDPVRYIANRSSGRMGMALAEAALRLGHQVTLVLGPVALSPPAGVRTLAVQTTQQMHDAVLAEFAAADLLIMAAAPADFRPLQVPSRKIAREQELVIRCVPTADILAAAGQQKQPHQRMIGFSLETEFDSQRILRKLAAKHADLMVYNPPQTMDSDTVAAVLFWPDGHSEDLSCRSKADFADILLMRAAALFTK